MFELIFGFRRFGGDGVRGAGDSSCDGSDCDGLLDGHGGQSQSDAAWSALLDAR